MAFSLPKWLPWKQETSKTDYLKGKNIAGFTKTKIIATLVSKLIGK